MPCEFFLLRYVPDVVKGEFVNIGVLLREAGPPHPRRGPAWAQVRFTRDWSRVRCLDAEADVGLLEGLEDEIAGRLRMEAATVIDPVLAASPTRVRTLVQTLEDTLANSVQISEPRASLAENMTVELEQLMRLYVEPMQLSPRRLKRIKTGRVAIQAALRTEFERAQVWSLMRKRIAAAAYTRPGDPLRLDCGYRAGAGETPGPNADAVIRLFQAVSLEGEVETAKVLAYSAPQLREGVARVEAARLELTAVVEPIGGLGDDLETEAHDRYRFGVETLERQQIRVITVNDLARAAATARHELGL